MVTEPLRIVVAVVLLKLTDDKLAVVPTFAPNKIEPEPFAMVRD